MNTDPLDIPRTREEWRALITRDRCRWDDVPLPQEVDAYGHPGGWQLISGGVLLPGRFWLSIQCPKCRYDWSLSKLGVPQP